jgi:integrase/recombinase XerD
MSRYLGKRGRVWAHEIGGHQKHGRGADLPALLRGGGQRSAALPRILTVRISNRITRAAYGRAAADFLQWCEGQEIDALGRVQAVHVAAYIEQLQGERSAPTVKQHLACIRMLRRLAVDR